MDVKKMKIKDLAKVAKQIKAEGGRKHSGKAQIAKALKSGAVLKKKVPLVKKLEKADPDFDH